MYLSLMYLVGVAADAAEEGGEERLEWGVA
jgi:hypothetical protein